MSLNSCLKYAFYKIVSFLRYAYHKCISLNIKKNGLSIISNDCIGGIIYHDLGLKFLSPTINLFFETQDDYLEFLSDVNYYSNVSPIQVERKDVNYPVGKLVKGDKEVLIHFMHYDTFENAVSKWVERGKRINYDKLFVIWHVGNENGPTKSDLVLFDDFKFIKKILITGNKCNYDYDYIVKLDLYSNKNYYPGMILDYPNRFSIKRYLDKTHYYKFI